MQNLQNLLQDLQTNCIDGPRTRGTRRVPEFCIFFVDSAKHMQNLQNSAELACVRVVREARASGRARWRQCRRARAGSGCTLCREQTCSGARTARARRSAKLCKKYGAQGRSGVLTWSRRAPRLASPEAVRGVGRASPTSGAARGRHQTSSDHADEVNLRTMVNSELWSNEYPYSCTAVFLTSFALRWAVEGCRL